MRLLVVLCVFAVLLSFASASRVHLSRRALTGHRERAQARVGAAVAASLQAQHKSGVSFVFTGSDKKIDGNVREMVPRANKAHPVTGPTGPSSIGKRFNTAGTPKDFGVVYLDIETYNSDFTAPFKTGTKTAATDADWAAFAAKSKSACDAGDFDMFLIAHKASADLVGNFLWTQGAMNGVFIGVDYLFTNVIKHADKRTKRLIVCACYGWYTKDKFNTALSSWNSKNPTNKWDPLFIANDQPMSLSEDGEWSTMTEASVKELAKGGALNFAKLTQTNSIKDLHVMKGGAEISPFPSATLTSVQKFVTCRKGTDQYQVGTDRDFAKAVLIEPERITQKMVDDAATACTNKVL